MTRLERVTNLLMAAAERLAPPSRREWIAAMRGEAAALERPEQGVAWAAGAVAAAVGWRLSHELPALLALAAVWVLLPILQMLAAAALAPLDRASDVGAPTFMLVFRLAHGSLAAAALFAFALYRFRLAVAVAIILPLWSFRSFLWPVVLAAFHEPMSSLGNEPALANWLFALEAAWMFVWPGLLGVAAAGAVKVVLNRRESGSSSAGQT